MPSLKAIDTDELWFEQHPDRKAMIRAAGAHEKQAEFNSLGLHDAKRRRIICLKAWNRDVRRAVGPVMRIPFLQFADESIENSDEVLLPVVHEIMMGQAPGAA